MHRPIKRYTIHILAIPAITPEVFDVPIRKCAIIACTNRDNKYLKLFTPKQRCIMPFADLEIPNDYRSINGAHARAIIRFLRQLPKSVTDLYVCCSKGGSKSPAVAAAVLRMSGRSDKVVWNAMCFCIEITELHKIHSPCHNRLFKLCKITGGHVPITAGNIEYSFMR